MKILAQSRVTVSSGKQDGLISKLEEKFSVLYTRSSYNKGRLIHLFFVQTAKNLGNYLYKRASNVNRFWIFLKKPTLVNIQIEHLRNFETRLINEAV